MRLRPVLVVSGLALLVLGCGDAQPLDDAPAASTVEDVANDGADDSDADPDDDQETDDTTEVVPFAVRATDTAIYVEPHPVSVFADDDLTDAERLVQALLTLIPVDTGVSTVVPPDVELLAAEVAGDILTVDLGPEVFELAGGSATEVAFAQQLAHTATQLDGVRAVQLLVDGEVVESLTGHVDFSVPVEPDPFALSPVTITNPVDGAIVVAGSSVLLEGEATVFEATVVIEVVGPSGSETAFTTASEGAPGRGTYTHELTFREPGTYTVTAAASDPSDGEGPAPFVTQVTIDVTPPPGP